MHDFIAEREQRQRPLVDVQLVMIECHSRSSTTPEPCCVPESAPSRLFHPPVPLPINPPPPSPLHLKTSTGHGNGHVHMNGHRHVNGHGPSDLQEPLPPLAPANRCATPPRPIR
jgi:hypothetical protein